MVTAASPFLPVCSWVTSIAVAFLKRTPFCRKSCHFGPLKLCFPPFPRDVVEFYAVLALASGLLSWKWTFSSARFQLRSRRECGMEVYCSTREKAALLGKLGSQHMEKLRCNARNLLHTPWNFWFVRILISRLSLRRFLTKFSMSHRRLGLFFIIKRLQA